MGPTRKKGSAKVVADRPDYEIYRLMVQEIKDYAIFVLDPKGRIVTWNAGAQRLKGYTREEVIGRHFSIFYPAVDRENKKAQHELEIAVTEGRVEDEGWRLRKDGTRFWANVVITPLYDHDGRLRGFAKVTRDLTERKKAEERKAQEAELLEDRVKERTVELGLLNQELEEANRMKDEFIATLSHELRTPLTAVTGWVQLLRSGELSDTQQEKALEVIYRNLTVQEQLINDLLNVSRIVTGRMKIELQPAYPAPMIEEAIDSLRPTIEAKSLRLTLDLDSRVGPIQLDPPRFHQIVWNLVSNAVKFTPKKGHIHVSLKRLNSRLTFQVADSGEGIDKRFLPYVFERFRQADSSRARPHGGLGIGLAIAKHLVELHGGTIFAESEGVGKGSAFSVTLPIPAMSARVSSGVTNADESSASLKGKKLLVVEDEVDTREMIAHAVKQQGATVIQTGSGEDALRQLKESRFDLLISDIGMPGMDGNELIRKVRSMKGTLSRIPAIALTAYASDDDRRLSLEAGFDRHLSKPVTLVELIRIAAKLTREEATETGQLTSSATTGKSKRMVSSIAGGTRSKRRK